MNDPATKRLFDLVEAKYDDQKDFAADIGVSPSIVSQWKNEITTSYTQKKRLPKIAEVLGTTTDYILHGTTNEFAASGDPEMMEYMAAAGEFTPEERGLIKGFIEGVRAKRK